MRTIRVLALCLGIASVTGNASADEGMWMPAQVPDLADRLARMGFKGDAKAFADLTGQQGSLFTSFRTTP